MKSLLFLLSLLLAACSFKTGGYYTYTSGVLSGIEIHPRYEASTLFTGIFTDRWGHPWMIEIPDTIYFKIGLVYPLTLPK